MKLDIIRRSYNTQYLGEKMKLDIIRRTYNTQDIDEKDEFEYITMAIQYTVLVRRDDHG